MSTLLANADFDTLAIEQLATVSGGVSTPTPPPPNPPVDSTTPSSSPTVPAPKPPPAPGTDIVHSFARIVTNVVDRTKGVLGKAVDQARQAVEHGNH